MNRTKKLLIRTWIACVSVCAFATVHYATAKSLKDGETISLFNGKDLTGWVGKGYEVKDGVLVCTPQGRNMYTKQKFTNYILELEIKISPKGNNGIGIHYTGAGNPAYNAMELQILDDPTYPKTADVHLHGGLYKLKAPKKGHLKPTGEWNKQKVTVRGESLKVELNGTLILDADLSKYKGHTGAQRRSGHIAFCGHGSPIEFRNIKLTKLPDQTVDKEGFTRIFNGVDLTGWEGRGSVSDVPNYAESILSAHGILMTKKKYKNYILDFKFQLPASGNNGLGIHYPGKGNAARNGMELQILDDDAEIHVPLEDSQYHGSLYKLQAAKRANLKPIGRWNHQRVTVNGAKVTVEVNGEVTLEANLDELERKYPKHKGVKRRSGHIALCGHEGTVLFKHVRIKELP